MKKIFNIVFSVSYFIMFFLVLNAYFNWEESKLWITCFYIADIFSVVFLIVSLIIWYKEIIKENKMRKKYEKMKEE